MLLHHIFIAKNFCPTFLLFYLLKAQSCFKKLFNKQEIFTVEILIKIFYWKKSCMIFALENWNNFFMTYNFFYKKNGILMEISKFIKKNYTVSANFAKLK